MFKILKCIFYIIIIFCTIKCTIHDYSTSLNLPVNEFEKGYKKINLSYEILPGADPRPSHTNGGSITATFGFLEIMELIQKFGSQKIILEFQQIYIFQK